MIYLSLIAALGLLLCIACYFGARELASLRGNHQPAKRVKLIKLVFYLVVASALMGALQPDATGKLSLAMQYDGNVDSYISLASIVLAIAAGAYAFIRTTNRITKARE